MTSWMEEQAKIRRRWTGVKPYYRRTLRNGFVRIYLRLADGSKSTMDVEPDTADQMPSGQSYTMEQYGP